jgi:selenocysteine lyase/cysteine desulfurase
MIKTETRKYDGISEKERASLIYPPEEIETPFGRRDVIYADFIASGKPSPVIEKYIAKNIYTRYSNTHSNASHGICMRNEIENVRDIVKRECGIDDTYEILFKGSGCTGAINYLIDCLNYANYKRIYFFISVYEHYSNHLPWVELAKKMKNAKLFIIPLTSAGELDVKWYEAELAKLYDEKRPRTDVLIITSIIHCSNLTGYFLPVENIRRIIDARRAPRITSYFFCDMACSAPYVPIYGALFDAFFISMHKFIGGVETPGVLVAKTCIFEKDHSAEPGGSCVKQTHLNEVEYARDIEVRESAGTPNIIGIIKIGLCFLLKRRYQETISNNEHVLTKAMRRKASAFHRKYRNFKYIAYADDVLQLPVFSFHLTNMHYNLVVVLLNDLFGIQSRGGKSCDGLLTDLMKDVHGMDGFCRISLHWTMSPRDISNIFDAVEYIIKHGDAFKSLYEYNERDNLFSCKKAAKQPEKR